MTSMEMDALEIAAKLKGLKDLPAAVSDWEVETGLDWTDYPSVWVYVYFEQDGVEFALKSKIREIVWDAVRALTGPSFWVYVRFRAESEKAYLASL